jgi:hypothetical protein
MFTRTTDGGLSWEPARAIFEPQSNLFTIGHQIAVHPSGTLIDIFDMGQGSGNNAPGFDMAIMRSGDRGETWTEPIKIAEEHAVSVRDPDTGFPVRSGAGLPDIAVDLNPASPGYGNLYAVWADAASTAKHKKTAYDNVVLTVSTDGGVSWSDLVEIDQSPDGVASFTPAVDVAEDGTVAVTYYDFRNNTPDPGALTDEWLIHCHPTVDCTDSVNWAENHVDGPFDIELAPVARGYFLGDYDGLASVGDAFVAVFGETTPTDQADQFYATVEPV